MGEILRREQYQYLHESIQKNGLEVTLETAKLLCRTCSHWQDRCEQAERERDDLKDEWDKLLYINSVLKILGDSGLTPEQSVVELGKRLKDAEAERAADVALLKEALVHCPHDPVSNTIGTRIEAVLKAKGEL